ncbi:MAG TPA: ATP-binding protein [Longimicrobiales bacterium]|nr:ATP-binding protein [Longimicrobiales bacterium]
MNDPPVRGPRRNVGIRVALFAFAATIAVAGILAGARTALVGSGALVGAVAFAAAILGGSAGALMAARIEASLGRLRDALAGRGPMPGSFRFAEVEDAARTARGRLRQEADRLAKLEREREDLAALLAAAGEGILLVSPEASITRANPAAARLLGLSASAEDLPVDSSIRAAPIRRAIHGALATGEPAATEQEIDGRRVFVHVEPTEQKGAVVSLVDLTEIRRLEAARRDFVANASHELKTPLTSIRGYAETLQDESLPPDVRRRFLHTIRQNAERLQRVVDDLLDLSRIEGGAWEPVVQSLSIAEAARDAWADLDDRTRGRDVHLEVGVGAEADVLADPFALRQILTNLLDNALRHSSDPAVVRVGAARQDADASAAAGEAADRPEVLIEVSDEGAGIPSAAVPRIFERFFRVDPARTEASGGTGLGLAIVKHLVEQMGGRVEARSELGHGTTVGFILPAAHTTRLAPHTSDRGDVLPVSAAAGTPNPAG